MAERTDADKKGGHLARAKATGGLLLREAAQCPDEDEDEFQSVHKYKFFNTNNLWVNLPALKKAFDDAGGLLPLPVIQNAKTVDPRDKKSTKESARRPLREGGWGGLESYRDSGRYAWRNLARPQQERKRGWMWDRG